MKPQSDHLPDAPGASGTPNASDRDHARFWRIPEGDCELLAARYACQAFGRHAHERYAIGALAAGAERMFYRGTHWQGGAGTVVTITPGEIHDGVPAADGGWSYRMLYLDPQWLQAQVGLRLRAGDHIHLFREPMRHLPALAQVVLQAHQNMENAASALERETLLLDVVARVFDASDAGQAGRAVAEREAVRRVRDKLVQDFSADVSLAELGALVNMDPLYLIRVFRRATGVAPHSFQLQERVAQAQRLLRAGSSIADVAYFCGFADQSHLARTFKKVVGVTPGVFRMATPK